MLMRVEAKGNYGATVHHSARRAAPSCAEGAKEERRGRCTWIVARDG